MPSDAEVRENTDSTLIDKTFEDDCQRPFTRSFNIMRKTDEEWLNNKSGRWVNMVLSTRARNDAEHLKKEPISNTQTVSDMCQTFEYALRTQRTFSFLNNASKLPKFCMMLDIGDEKWFLHSSKSMLIGTLMNIPSEHDDNKLFESAYVMLLEEFETLYSSSSEEESMSLVLFYAQARNTLCANRYYELRVVGRKPNPTHPDRKLLYSQYDHFDADIGHRLITSSNRHQLRRYVGRTRQTLELGRLQHQLVVTKNGRSQTMDAVVSNQLQSMLRKFCNHFVFVDVDADTDMSRYCRPESPSAFETADESDTNTASEAEPCSTYSNMYNAQSAPPSCHRCQTTMNVMQSKVQMYEQTLAEARANVNETIGRETEKTRHIQQKLDATELLNKNMADCHYQEIAKMRTVVESQETELKQVKLELVDKTSQLKQNELLIEELTENHMTKSTKKKRSKKRTEEVEPASEMTEDESNAEKTEVRLQREIQTLNEKLLATETECADLKLQVDENATLISEASDKTHQLSIELKQANQELDKQMMINKQATTAQKQLQSTIDKSSNDLHTMKQSNIRATKALNKKHETEQKRLQEQMSSLLKERDELQMYVDQLKDQLSQVSEAASPTTATTPVDTTAEKWCEVESPSSLESIPEHEESTNSLTEVVQEDDPQDASESSTPCKEANATDLSNVIVVSDNSQPLDRPKSFAPRNGYTQQRFNRCQSQQNYPIHHNTNNHTNHLHYKAHNHHNHHNHHNQHNQHRHPSPNHYNNNYLPSHQNQAAYNSHQYQYVPYTRYIHHKLPQQHKYPGMNVTQSEFFAQQNASISLAATHMMQPYAHSTQSFQQAAPYGEYYSTISTSNDGSYMDHLNNMSYAGYDPNSPTFYSTQECGDSIQEHANQLVSASSKNDDTLDTLDTLDTREIAGKMMGLVKQMVSNNALSADEVRAMLDA